MKIKIVDSICGSGKTSAIIEMIKNDTSNNKYIYITPFLTEVKRIKDSCKNKHFCEPKYTGKGNKSFNFNNLILKGKNIVSTHALFQKATQDTIALIKSNNYILILDEVFNVVEQLNISKDEWIKGVRDCESERPKWLGIKEYDDFVDLDAFIGNLAHDLLRDYLDIDYSSFYTKEVKADD